MAGNTIEARLRIAADLAQASAALRRLRKEVTDTGDAAKQATGGTDLAGGVKADADARRQAAADAKKAAADQRTADRAAAAEARKLATEKRAEIAAQKKAQREAADEAKKAAAAEAARLREQNAAAQRARRAQNADTQKQVVLGQQITDSVVGLATGQSPLTILLQQGGQVRDIFGGIGNGLRAIGALLTPVRLAIGGVLALGAAIITAGVQGALETDRLNKSLARTGNIAGTSAGQLDQQARAISSQQNTAIGDVRAALAAAADSGVFMGSTLSSASRAATALGKITGATADESIKDFADMGKGVADWAEKANKSYNFLTVEQFKHIRALEAEGRAQEAMRVTLDALAATMEGRTAQALGTLEKLWLSLGKAASSFWDTLKGIGREETAQQQIDALSKKLEVLIALRDRMDQGQGRGGKRKSTVQAEIDAAEAERQQLQREVARSAGRDSDASAAAAAKQEEMRRQGLAFQNLIAGQSRATAERALADRMALLDREQQGIEDAHAKGLTSELQYNVALSRVNVSRLKAQEALLLEQQKIQGAIKPGSVDETIAQATAMQQLDTELKNIQSRIRVAGAQARNLTDANALATSRDSAQQWAQVWQQAVQQVRQLSAENAAAAAAALTDPADRSRAQAAAAVASLKRSIEEQTTELQLRLSLTLDPGARAELQKQIDALTTQGRTALDRQTREAEFRDLQTQASEALDRVRLAEAAIDEQVQRGMLTTLEGERRKAAARAGEIDQLQKILRLLAGVASTPAEANALEQLRQQLVVLADTATQAQATMRGAISGGFGQMFTDIVTGSESAGRAFGNFLSSVAKAALNLIAQDLGQQLARSMMPGQGGSGGGILGSIGSFVASFFHTGGLIGSGGRMARAVSPALFAGAQVLHSGGLVLAPDERPVIAKVGEEMLTADDPRHRNNFRPGASIGAINVSVAIDQAGGQVDQQQGAQLGTAIEAAVITVIERESRPGGILAKG